MISPEVTLSAENLDYVRFILLLIKEGTVVLRKIVINGLKEEDLSAFLSKNKSQILQGISSEQKQILYPSSGDASDLSKWDISLLAKICRRYYTKENSLDRQAVDKIKDWRNKYFHRGEAMVDAGDFDDLSNVIRTLTYNYSENEVSNKIDVIARIQELGIDTALEQLKSLDPKLSESIEGRFGKIEGRLNTFEQRMNQEVRELREEIRKLSVRHDWEATVPIQTVDGEVFVSLRSSDSLEAVTRVKRFLFEICQKTAQHADRINALEEKVANVFRDLEGVGGKVVVVREGSVVFFINCTSLTDLIYVIDYFYSPRMQCRLSDIAKELRKETGHEVDLMADIQPKSLKELLKKLQGEITHQDKGGVETKTPQVDSKSNAKALIERLKQKKSQSKQAGSTEIATDKHTLTSDRKRKKTMSKSQKLLSTIDNYANRCREMIKKLEAMFKNKSEEIQKYPQVQAWVKDLADIENKLDFKPMEIAVIGNTGEGKSCLLNAVLDQRDVLPASGMKGCTATVVEVVQSETDDFEAEIEFLTEKKWFDELRTLIKDLSDENGILTKKKPERTSDVYKSYCKMIALYGEIDEFDVLSKKTEFTEWLGKIKQIKHKNLDNFKKEVESYLVQEPSSGQTFWPIVKRVRLKLPGCDVCSSGAVLVDLPGQGDSDAAINAVAKSYLETCDLVWIVSSIQRAVNDRSAKELLGEYLRNQLYMNGQFGVISFICTKTDELEPRELKRELKELESLTKELDDDLGRLDERRKNVSTNIEESKDELKELKSLKDESFQDADGSMGSEEEEELKRMIESVEKSICEKEDELRSLDSKRRVVTMSIKEICAKARNTYCESRINKEFKSSYEAIENASKNASKHANSDRKDLTHMNIDDLAETLRVFCCSSQDYQYIKHSEPENKVFSKAEDTQIPKLRNFVHDLTGRRKNESLTDAFYCLNGFVSSVQSYLSDKKDRVWSTSKEDKKLSKPSFTEKTIDSKLQYHKKDMNSFLDRLDSNLREIFDKRLISLLKAGASDAADKAMETCTRLGGLHHRTYQAAVKRHGVFLDIDFNGDLAKPIFKNIAFTWGNTFWDNGSLKKTLDAFKNDTLRKRKQFLDDLFENFGIEGTASNLRETQERIASLKMTDTVQILHRGITLQQRRISGIVVPRVQKCLFDVYTECAEIKGKGMKERIKYRLSEGIREKRRTMFVEVAREMEDALHSIQETIVRTLREKSNNLIEDLKIALEPLWDDSTILSTAFYQDITNISSEVQKSLEEFKKETEDPVLKRRKLSDPSESAEPMQSSSK